jgi:diguanylate cyclase (GGDEF)-like protein/PAS domain S-box-containing protein
LEGKLDFAFDDLAKIAAEVCHTSVAAVGFLAQHRQWIQATTDANVRETLLDVLIHTDATLQHDVFVLPDTARDARFRNTPLVTDEPRLRFYAGAVLLADEGTPLGALYVADTKPRPQGLTTGQTEVLRTLARAIMRELKLRWDNWVLAERERELTAVVDDLPQMAWIACADGHHEYRNRRYYDFTGAAPGSINGKGWNKVGHPEDHDQAWAKWNNSVRTGEPYEAEYRLRHHAGEYRWVLARALPVRDNHGRVQRWIGTCTDIHDWKLAQEALAESEERYRALVEASTGIVWRASPDGSILQGWGWEASRGQRAEVYEGIRWTESIHPDDRDRLLRIWQELLVSGQTGMAEYRVRHNDGEYRWTLTRAVPLKQADGSIREWVGTITDIHEQKQSQEALRTGEERLRLAIETTALGIWDVDLIMGSLQWTPETRDILGLSPDVPATRETFLARVHPDDRAQVESKRFIDVPGKGLSYSGTFRIIRADNGEERWVASDGRTLLNESGQAVRKIGTIQDITSRKLSEDALRASEERLQLALQAARMFAWEQDLATNYITRSQHSIGLLGIGSGPLVDFFRQVPVEDQAQRQEFLSRVDEMGSDTMEFRYTLPSGKTLWLASRAQKAGPDRVVGVTFDISDRKLAEEEIWRTANHDALTGLPNRVLFQRCLEQALAEAKQRGTAVSLLLIDLDDFKDVNDTLGHDAGDALLKETAARLAEMMRGCDMVARLGGDEFAVLVVEPLQLSHAINLADTITEGIRQPFTYEGRMIVSRASIGIAAFPDHDTNPVELMKDADIALYRAKGEGRARVVTYSPEMRAAAEQRLTLGRDIREAISRDQILPFYQPKVCLTTGRIVGFEALARWQHPANGLLTPAIFGAAFDDPEVANAIGKRLIGKIASDMRSWMKAGLDPGRVAVNMSSAEFSQPDLAEEVLRILDLVKVPTRHFEIEVTEKVLLEGRSGLVSATLETFRKRGVQIALDDFGTGYASLTHLKQFPVDHIKIDQSFVRDLEKASDDAAIVEAVIGLGKSLNLHVTAEGVETEGQVQRLREMGCHAAQGYFYAKPIEAGDVARLLSKAVHERTDTRIR